MLKINYRIAELADKEKIFEFAKGQLLSQEKMLNAEVSEFDIMMKIWESKFRLEALEHYLKLGWSFIAEDENSKNIYGFFIGQPLLFFEGHTQNLWVETIVAYDDEIKKHLVDISVKLSRDKHLQRVILPLATQNILSELNYKFNEFSQNALWVKTTK